MCKNFRKKGLRMKPKWLEEVQGYNPIWNKYLYLRHAKPDMCFYEVMFRNLILSPSTPLTKHLNPIKNKTKIRNGGQYQIYYRLHILMQFLLFFVHPLPGKSIVSKCYYFCTRRADDTPLGFKGSMNILSDCERIFNVDQNLLHLMILNLAVTANHYSPKPSDDIFTVEEFKNIRFENFAVIRINPNKSTDVIQHKYMEYRDYLYLTEKSDGILYQLSDG